VVIDEDAAAASGSVAVGLRACSGFASGRSGFHEAVRSI